MIEHWSLSNFKSVKENTELKFSPLTLFVGQNSAGKSTLIQSILLTAQTIQSSVLSRSCILNGRIIKLGSFSDIKSNGSSEVAIKIGFTLGKSPYADSEVESTTRVRFFYPSDIGATMKSVSISYSFSSGGGQKDLEMQPRLESGSVQFESNDGSTSTSFDFQRSNQTIDARLNKLGVLPTHVRLPDLSALDFDVVKGEYLKLQRRVYRLPATTYPAGVMLRHFLPIGAAAAYDAVAEEVDATFEMLSEINSGYRYRRQPESLTNGALANPAINKIIIDVLRGTIKTLVGYARERAERALQELETVPTLEALTKAQGAMPTSARKAASIKLAEREAELKGILRNNRPKRMEIAQFMAPEQIAYTTEYVSGFFLEYLKYLGPLRDEPKAIYPTGSNDPKDVGFRGEYTAAVLDNNKTTIVGYISSDSFPTIAGSPDVIKAELASAVSDWLGYLGIAHKVESEDKGKLGHELTIATSGNAELHDLTHVGVGVSQALPIVVLSLLADSGATLLFEQPELHLHPKVQTRLADFFMSLVLAGKQCIVETHSEYLISRLRFLSAKADSAAISNSIKIYFVEKPGPQSIYREVEITDSGSVKNWPEGFFDDAEQNAAELIQAQIDKAMTRKKK